MLPSCPGKPSFLLSRAKQGAILPSSHPNALFFVSPSPTFVTPSPLLSFQAYPFFVSPRRQPRGLHVRRRPERSEGCLAIARRVGDEMLRFAQHDRMEGHDRMEDVAPSPTLCVAQSPLLSPRGLSRGVPRRLRASGRHGGKLSPQAPLTQKVY
jgi:hypothetical protein